MCYISLTDFLLDQQMERTAKPVYVFGSFCFDAGQLVVYRNGVLVPLTSKALETLRVLVESAGAVVDKQELMRRVWPDVFVEEGALSQNIFRLRKILGEGYIETIPRRGYRFTAPVELARDAKTRLGRRWWPWAAVAAGTVGLLVVGARAVDRNPRVVSLRGAEKITQNGQALAAAISPDGSRVAYLSGSNHATSLLLADMTSGQQREVFTAGRETYFGLSFSPDGRSIYALRDHSIVRMPAGGGNWKTIAAGVEEPASIAPNGVLAFVREDLDRGESSIWISSSDGSGQRRVVARQLPRFYRNLAWRPDGGAIACSGGLVAGTREMGLFEVSVASGTERAVGSRRWTTIDGVAWHPAGRGMYLTAAEGHDEPEQLWFVSYPNGSSTRVSNDVFTYHGASVSGSGRLVTVDRQDFSELEVWKAGNSGASRLDSSTPGVSERQPAFTADGRIVYAAVTGGRWQIWIRKTNGTGSRRLTWDGCDHRAPSVSRDGRFIAYVSDCGNGGSLGLMNLDGSGASLLREGDRINSPDVAPDGSWVVFEANVAGKPVIWKLAPGGHPVPMTAQVSRHPMISPDGRWVAMYYWSERQDSPRQLIVLPFAGGEQKYSCAIPDDGQIQALRWTPDGRALLYLMVRNGEANIWKQVLDASPPTPVTDFKDALARTFDVFPDGDRYVIERARSWSDVVLFRF
jgi:Tol biopolymer transport system component/DNA-binding winged helix-turn-helix (wHTH) protein